jgi:glycine oxidase
MPSSQCLIMNKTDTPRTLTPKRITVIGAGISGLWAARTLALRGHIVRLIETSKTPFEQSASRYAGAMLAPYCEAEAAEPIVRDLGIEALALWRAAFPAAAFHGSLVLAQPRDRAELLRFARLTQAHETVDEARLEALEPDLAGRYASALFYPGEGHMAPAAAMTALLAQARAAGCDVRFGENWEKDDGEDLIVDCRGLAARGELPTLRGVRGERVLLRAKDVTLSRPVRLLHPRFPLYIVPWGEGTYMVGATVIETEDAGPMTARSALELLGAAYAVHPAFGEAEILELGAGIRPAFPDNVPRLIVGPGAGVPRLHINGLYRHGFLLSPILAEIAAGFAETGDTSHPIFLKA